MRVTTSWAHRGGYLRDMDLESVMERVAIAVLWHDGKVLIGPRARGDLFAGLWEFPGGKISSGEAPSTAAVRECREETGLDVVVLGTCAEVVHCYPAAAKSSQQSNASSLKLHLLFFACRPLNRIAPVTPPFRWVRSERLSSLKFPAANHDLVTQLSQLNFIEKFWSDGA